MAGETEMSSGQCHLHELLEIDADVKVISVCPVTFDLNSDTWQESKTLKKLFSDLWL